MVMPTELATKETTSWDDAETTDALGNSVTSSSWTLKYEFRGAASKTLTAVANSTGWRTSTLVDTFTVAGTYYWQAILTTPTSGTVTGRIILSEGRLVVKTNMADAAANFDGRTQERQDLEAVETAIRVLVSGAVKSYTIGTRSVTKQDMGDLIVWRDRLKAEVARQEAAEKVAAGLGRPNSVFVRFTKR
jgi:hypothetical protein